MKFFALCFVIGLASAARLDNTYIPPPNSLSAGGNGGFLDAPKQEYLPPHSAASNVRNSFSSGPQQHTYTQQQSVSRPGSQQNTFTSISQGNGFQSASAGSGSRVGPAYQAPVQQYNGYQQQNNGYRQPASYSGATQYQSAGAGQSFGGPVGPTTTPIPILEYENVNNGDGSYKWK